MPEDAEKRLHRCCFSGQRPEKLDESSETVQKWLEKQIDTAISDGFTTFITGCSMGVEIWAAQIVLHRKLNHPELHLIAAVPWSGFSSNWNPVWQQQYNDLIRNADMTVNVSNHFHNKVFTERNEWMVNHSSRVIAYYNGAPGGTREMIAYARNTGVEVVDNGPVLIDSEAKVRGVRRESAESLEYPENLITDIGLEKIFGENRYIELDEDRLKGLEYAIGTLPQREQELVKLRYKDRLTLQKCGANFGFSKSRAQQLLARIIRKLGYSGRSVYIRDGFEKADLEGKIECARTIRTLLEIQKRRYPLMNEEDIVKFAFHGMLGVGGIITSEEKALEYVHRKMQAVQPQEKGMLTERLSTCWFRYNLAVAKAKGMTDEEIAAKLYQSSQEAPLTFTRQNVYNFCVKLDKSEAMIAAASKVLDEKYVPRHSKRYTEAYHPSYIVVFKTFRKT